MDVWPTSQIPARWDVTLTADPASATVRVQVNGEWYDADWASLAVPNADGTWTRTLQLSLAGVDAPEIAGTAVVLQDDEPPIEVTIGDTVLVGKSSKRLVVKS